MASSSGVPLDYWSRFQNVRKMIEQVVTAAAENLHFVAQHRAWGLDRITFGPTHEANKALNFEYLKLLLLLWNIKDYLEAEKNKLKGQLEMIEKLEILTELYNLLPPLTKMRTETVHIETGDGTVRVKQQPVLNQQFLEDVVRSKRRRLDIVRAAMLDQPLEGDANDDILATFSEPAVISKENASRVMSLGSSTATAVIHNVETQPPPNEAPAQRELELPHQTSSGSEMVLDENSSLLGSSALSLGELESSSTLADLGFASDEVFDPSALSEEPNVFADTL